MSKTHKQDGYLDATIGRRRPNHAMPSNNGQLYALGGIYARMVDKPADDAMSAGIEIDGDNGSLKTEWERLEAAAKLADALRWVRLCGGACVVLLTADDTELTEPPKQGARIEELRIYAADQVQVHGNRYNDPKRKNYGQPMRYTISDRHGSFEVHESRLLPLTGEPLPPQMQGDLYWQGRSMVGQAYQAARQWYGSLEKTLHILDRKQQPVYKMQGLAEAIAQGLETDVQQRINMADTVRGILNTVAIDGGDDYNIIDLSLTGLPETINEFKERMAAESGIPLTLLFGRQTSGLSGSQEGDLRGYYDMVQGLRVKSAQPAIERLLQLLSEQDGINVTDNWRIVWPPLLKANAKEQADIDKMEAERWQTAANALNIVIQTAALSEQEAREFLQGQYLFGLRPDKPPE